MSPNTVFPHDESPTNPMTLRVLDHPRVTFHVDDEALVIAIKDELLVRASAAEELRPELDKIATLAGSLSGGPQFDQTGDTAEHDRPEDSAAFDVPDDTQIWRLTTHGADSIDVARRLRKLVPPTHVRTRRGPAHDVPAVSPNHVCVVAKYNVCPASPPHPIPPPHDSKSFIEAPGDGPRAQVVVIDTGYITTAPPHAALDARVNSVSGVWLDTMVSPPRWRACPPDQLDADGDGRLDGVAGHGTFIAGIVAHGCRQADITVVGERHAVMAITATPNVADQVMMFSDEVSVARTLLLHSDADVVSCGFAFPTLDALPSIPFSSVMAVLAAPGARGVAVVSPAGNESSRREFWPAAHPDVIGVASTNRWGNRRAWFSNWGPWADCCARGQDVRSTYIYWDGPVEGEPPTEIENFSGWARWDGTSFATPKVAAAIARLVAESGNTLPPVQAYEMLISNAGGVPVTPMTDMTLSGFPGVTLPHLHLG